MSNYLLTANFEIVCFCETWLTDTITDSELFLTQYSVYRSDRVMRTQEVSSHGGVLIGVNNAIHSWKLQLPALFTGSASACICLINSLRVLIVCCYFPPSSSKYRLSTENIIFLFSYLNSLPVDHTIITGDFNFGNVDWNDYSSSNDAEQLILDTIESYNLYQHVDFLTTNRNMLDLVMTSSDVDCIACIHPG